MSTWPTVELGAVATIDRTVVLPVNIDASTPYVGLENIEHGGAITNVATVGESKISSAKFRFTEQQVLFGKLRPYLAKISRPTFSGVCSTDILPISPGVNLDKGYLCYFLSLPDTIALATSRASGANLPRLAPKELTKFQIPLPPIAEQRRIAQLLDSVDALRAKRHKAIALLDNLAQAIFLDMFGNDGNQSILALDKHLLFVTSGGRGWAKYYSPHGVRFIRSLDVRMNEICNRDAVYVIAPDNAEARRTRTEEGDVLLTITGSLIGRVASVPSSLQGSYVSQHVAILRASRESLRPEFLSFYLSLPFGGQRQIRNMQYGQTKPGLNFEQIRSIEVPIPPISAQNIFLRQLTAIRQLRADNFSHLAELDALFASLQHRAFCGELWTDSPAA